jgi:hypothetical protein
MLPWQRIVWKAEALSLVLPVTSAGGAALEGVAT